MKNNLSTILFVLISAFTISCGGKSTQQKEAATSIEQVMLSDSTNFFYINANNSISTNPALPIGVFDSGTGGLTVLDELVSFDGYSNDRHTVGKDGKPDFEKEKFIYLADQANMPYGNYYAANKSDLLVEHILKDAQFLLSNKYYADENAKNYNNDKESVKAIVVACNTATAYGKDSIVSFLKKAGIDIPVIGVIDAGAKGALDLFSKNESGTIGVFATVGTIASKGYENTLNRLKDKMDYTGNIQIYNQGGHGVAEVVDEEPEYINRTATTPYDSYLGPSLNHEKYKISLSLLDIYQFDFSNNKMLYEKNANGEYTTLQINSADNYIRYHLVELLERLRKENAQALKAIILGCTHYPYLLSEINNKLNELYNYKKDEHHYYRNVMSKNITLINPAENVAIELHTYLNDNNLFNSKGSIKESEFYISVPNKDNKNAITDAHGRFSYDYKYGRIAGEIQEYVKVVPFSISNVQHEVLKRLENMIPNTFALIVEFSKKNPKTANISSENKINFSN
ncbi:MAG: hypothetical protein LBG19_00560 [Prevotellaceae bacterium]|jgi:glutamate racemase|nr:hypothetical protein [Prevotellaceae bacterium]